MKHMVLLAGMFASAPSAFAQTSADYAVRMWAEVQASPPSITLQWQPMAGATSYDVYRKSKASNTWTQLLGNVPGTDSTYQDNSVSVGTEYEYRVVKNGTTAARGYILAGIEVPEVTHRGTIVLVVDTTYLSQLASEIEQLKLDMVGDGWAVQMITVDPLDSVASVKALIVSLATNPDVKAVFLLGHVAVPYSGDTYPDGHPDHEGAWPADVFYGDINGTWTDASVNVTVASQARHHNVPGDGKYDQTVIPSDIDLQVGRVDFFDMPAFTETERQLLKRYLDKNHAFRHKEFTAEVRALVDDNFGAFGGEAFGSNGWRNFGPLVGPANVTTTDYRVTMNAQSYMWSYGCGGGSYTSAGGIGSTNDFKSDSLQTVFTMLFGSYFGDWDSQNNFLRAAIAQGQTLTNCWAGRPWWQFHQMALGENIGYCVRRSQNSPQNSPYYSPLSFMQRNIHMALMGDPTLRMHVIAPAKNLEASLGLNQAQLTWSSSADTVLGYHVFKSRNQFGRYEKVNSAIITDTFFTDPCVVEADTFFYMVRVVRLESSPAGSYYNMSQGVFDSLVNTIDISVTADFSVTVDSGEISLSNQSANAMSSWWDFGDGNTSTQWEPVHDYTSDGTYIITLIASSACDADTMTYEVTIGGVGVGEPGSPSISVRPNPAREYLVIDVNIGSAGFALMGSDGRVVLNGELHGDRSTVVLPAALAPGVYALRITSWSGQTLNRKVMIQ